ncbi:ribosomal protection-like ABC-F family protein [Oceanirhabdus seepicola]|uniref:ABC-F family ATP-binding cassette domain-containing protein n=1 Tax=Oceanirhabdus seepicola TaxID=2828781 RepID=A0A9J6P1E8_9CLOT|nr:ABC-F family ATP-binding cassette domain-containing protein [Oceanirhabdus seepicola]MCM1990244.1 ABC-F family ATP-binding cassette domain-containing protein [Oceanirhabdus seepicola]
MVELSFNNIKKYLDATLVFKNLSFNIYDNERVGIVGANGCGKTTVLKMIAGIEEMTRHDDGWMSIPRGKSIGYLEQVHKYPENYTVRDILNISFQELIEIEVEMKSLESEMAQINGEELDKTLKRYSYLQQAYEAKGGYDKEEKMSRVCKGLKLEEAFLNKEFKVLSGGEKTTVILGKILLETPDILLLDEPTNHLDMESAEWLENYIKNYRGIVIIVSHDRYFLDNTVGKIIEIEDMECITYKGNYSDFVKQKDEDMLQQFHQFKEQQKQIKSMKNTIKDLRDWALRADNNKFFKRAASIQIKLDKMERIDKPKFEKQNMKMNFSATERSGNEVIVARELSKSYEDKVLFKDSDMLIKYQERAALIGANGSGKTTFLKILLGEESSDGGRVKIGENVKVAYLPQNISFNDEELTVVECFREDINILEGKAREFLSKFMFFGGEAYKKVKHLSGGERVRLKLSKLLYEDINLLILDEPTNHLDIESIETLENALEEFKGTVFFISHDRYFINKMSNKIIEIDNNNFVNYDGNYDFYKKEKSNSKEQVIEQPKEKKEKIKKSKRVDENKKIEREVTKLENRISVLEEEIREIDEKMNSIGDNYGELKELHYEREEKIKELDNILEQWSEWAM